MGQSCPALEVFLDGLRYTTVVKDWRQHIEVIEADDHVRPLDEILDDVVSIAIDHYGGNVSATAEYLGVTRATVYSRLRRIRLRVALSPVYPK